MTIPQIKIISTDLASLSNFTEYKKQINRHEMEVNNWLTRNEDSISVHSCQTQIIQDTAILTFIAIAQCGELK
jgi:hypothetical protein